MDYIKGHALPVVLKADGLAAGKGVLICQSHIEALAEFELMIMRSKFGEAGKKVIVEEFPARNRSKRFRANGWRELCVAARSKRL